MERQSPYLLAKQLEANINSVLSGIDAYVLETKPRKIVVDIKRQVVDARLDARDYELSETRAEQLKNAKIGKKRLEILRKNLLAASEYSIFTAVDVALTSAQIEQIMEGLV